MSMDEKILIMNIGFLFPKKSKNFVFSIKNNDLDFRIDHVYTFFLRWNPDRALDPSLDDSYPNNNTNTNLLSTSPHSQSKHNETSSAKGFVLLANDDPELTDDYILTKNKNNNSSKPRTSSSDGSGVEPKNNII